MRVAAVFPPLRVSRDFIDYPYFADLGTVQAAGVLRAAGHEVVLVDALALPGASLAPDGGSYVRLGAPAGEVASRVIASSPEVVVVGVTPFHRPPTRDPLLGGILVALRDALPGVPLLLADLYQSGQHVVDAPSLDILAALPEADAILRYEAEADLDEFVREFSAAGRPRSPIVRRGVAPPSLDVLPLPAWDLVDLEAYWAFHESVVASLGRPSWAFPIHGRTLPLLSSRGCPFHCIHCSSNPGRETGAPKTQRRYSAAYLDRALDDLARRGARRVHVLDELANVNGLHFDVLLASLERSGMSFEIPNGLRADYIEEKHLSAMRGRVTTLSVSAESGDPGVVRRIVDKQLDLAAVRLVADRAKAASIPLLVHFMIGLPGETRAEINRTLEFALDLHEKTDAWPSVQFATPLPGTRLAELAAAQGRKLPAVDDWGPRFQHEPSIETDEFSLEDVRRFKWTFDQRLSAGSGPKKVVMNVTYRCNNHCNFCASGTRSQLDGDFDRQREILVKYRKLGVRRLDLDGGEPTLNPNLFALVKFARRIGYENVNVTTNGRMASYRAYARDLASSGVTSLLFSIHGPNARIHAQSAGVAEAFDQTIAGVRNVVGFAPPGVEIGSNVTITKSNWQTLPEMAAMIHALGLRWWNLQFLTPKGRATRSICPDTEAAVEVVKQVIDRWRGEMKLEVVNLPFCFMPGYEKYLAGDLLKLERNMIFVNNDEVNLFEYLHERRVKKDVCEGCPHSVFCGGFYEMRDLPEPAWLLAPEDLVRPVAREVPLPGAPLARRLNDV